MIHAHDIFTIIVYAVLLGFVLHGLLRAIVDGGYPMSTILKPRAIISPRRPR